MAFQSTQTDYFGITTADSNIVITSSDENKTTTLVQAHNSKGDFIAQDTCGDTEQPSCSYIIKGDVALGSLTLGKPATSGTKKYALTSFNIETSAGSPPSISASGEEIPNDSHDDCYYDIPASTLKVCHHAQLLWDCITQSEEALGAGVYLTQSSYSAQSNLTKATKDGTTLAYDVMEGQLTATLTFQQTGTTTPTVTASTASGWVVTSPLSKSCPDADYPTWTITLSKALTHHATSGQ